jgi:hypothetical protein
VNKDAAVVRFNVADGVLWERVDTRVMLIDRASSELVTLNPVGSVVWQALAAEPMNLAALIDVVTAAFPGVPHAQISTDVETFLDELVQLGFVSTDS